MGKNKTIKWDMFILGIITAVIGVLIVANPDSSATTIIRIIGIILLVLGVIALISGLTEKKKGFSSYGDFAIGVFAVVFGILLLASPATFAQFIGFIFGIFIAVQGINDIIQAFTVRKLRDPKWTGPLLVGVICIVLAAVMIFNPFSTFKALMIMIGVSLIIDGVTEILVGARVGIAKNRFDKAQKAAADKVVDASYTVDDAVSDAMKAGKGTSSSDNAGNGTSGAASAGDAEK
ncbi:MAG: HdeD family acid-resistance protein [Eubacterium sp.]|jgi:hypothetical protein